jgi:hypothetical protein
LLTLLDAIGEPVGPTGFQKLLFLYTPPSYDFVPYKFGAFSFASCADKRKLIAEGLLAEDVPSDSQAALQFLISVRRR